MVLIGLSTCLSFAMTQPLAGSPKPGFPIFATVLSSLKVGIRATREPLCFQVSEGFSLGTCAIKREVLQAVATER